MRCRVDIDMDASSISPWILYAVKDDTQRKGKFKCYVNITSIFHFIQARSLLEAASRVIR